MMDSSTHFTFPLLLLLLSIDIGIGMDGRRSSKLVCVFSIKSCS